MTGNTETDEKYPKGVAKITLLGRFVAYLFKQFVQNQGTLNAAALTYTTLFAVVPLLTVTYTMLSSVPSFQGMGGEIEDLIFQNFLPETGVAVREYLSGFANQARSLTTVGVVFLIITTYMMIKTIEGAFNRIWRIRQPRKGLSSFLLYWAVLSLGPMLLGLGFALTSYITSLPLISDATNLAGQFGALKLLPILTSTAAFTLIYVAVPNCFVPIKHAVVGGFVVALMFEGAKQAFALYVIQFPSYQLIYGAFATVPLFLLWIFISWVIVLIGAELVRAQSYFQEDDVDHPSRKTGWLLLIIEHAWLNHQKGEKVSMKTIKRAFPQLAASARDEYLTLLTANNIFEKTAAGGFVLNRDLQHLPLIELLSDLTWAIPKWVRLPVERPWLAPLNEQLKAFDQRRRDHFDDSLHSVLTRSESAVSNTGDK